MAFTTESGLHLPNRWALIEINALEDIVGANGFKSLLHLAGLHQLVGFYPPDDMEPQYDFAFFAAMNAGLEDLYGFHAARMLAIRAGRATYPSITTNFGNWVGMEDSDFEGMDPVDGLRISLGMISDAFSLLSDQISTVDELDDRFVYRIERCSACWERESDHACCYIWSGLLLEATRRATQGMEIRVEEVACHAKGDEACSFEIFKPEGPAV